MVEKEKQLSPYGDTAPGRNEISEEITAIPLENGECCHRSGRQSRIGQGARGGRSQGEHVDN